MARIPTGLRSRILRLGTTGAVISTTRRNGTTEVSAMALYLQARQIAIWEFSPKFSARENIQIALTKMANFRQASTDETSLKSYAIALEDLDLRAFQVAMAIISETTPREGETLFPSLGYVLDVMDEARERFTTARRPQLNTAPVMAGQKLLEGSR